MQALLDLAGRLPHRLVESGEVLIAEGDAGGRLFVLVDGALRVEKNGVVIASIATPGGCVGELSSLLGIPATADVVASVSSTVAVVEDAARVLAAEPHLVLALARLLAARVQDMTTYLADLQLQYTDHEGGLGMVGVVLGTLMHEPATPSQLGSERDPHPEY
jgi:CRP/FNR family transcriptional regulator, cyclic AMP receptor protein